MKHFQDGSSLHLFQTTGSKDLLTSSKEETRHPLVRLVPVESVKESLLVIRTPVGAKHEDVPIMAFRIPKVVGRGVGEEKFAVLDAVRLGQVTFLLYNNGLLIFEACAVKAIDRKAKGAFVPSENPRNVIFRESESSGEVVLSARIASIIPEIRVEFEVSGKGQFVGIIKGDKVIIEPVKIKK